MIRSVALLSAALLSWSSYAAVYDVREFGAKGFVSGPGTLHVKPYGMVITVR